MRDQWALFMVGKRFYGLLGDISVDPGDLHLAEMADAQDCRLKFYINKTLRFCVLQHHPFVSSNGLAQVPAGMQILRILTFYLNFENFSPICLVTFSYKRLTLIYREALSVVVSPSCK